MRKLLTFALLLLNIAVLAQITGRVTDKNGVPLPMAAIALYQEDKILTGTTSDEEGRFFINTSAGRYRLEVSFISYVTRSLDVNVPASGSVNLGAIEMAETANALEEVTVEAQANMMEFQQDKRVYNIGKDLSNVGSNASDILNNVPSVSVGVEGNISLRGSENVRILIDGKPSGLVGSDPATALRQLQSSMIEKVEVITNPSARYDAEGEAGIINIVLKKDQKAGFNGNFEATTGYPNNHGVTAGVNYRTGKFNLFANGSLNYRRSPGGGFSEQTFTEEDTTYSIYRDQDRYRGGTSAALRFGADYILSETQTLTGTFLYRPSLGNNFSRITYYDYGPGGALEQTVIREDKEREEERTLEGDIHYEKRFGKKDHKLTADIKFQDDDDGESSNIEEDTVGSPGTLFQKVNNIENEQNLLIQADYVHPFTENRSFEAGVKATLRDIVNNYSVKELDESGTYHTIGNLTNNFNYMENIYAAYGIYNDSYGNLKYQLGLRTEYSDISTKLESEEKANPKKYINFFPSAFFTYDINELSDVQVNYSRRISRPHFRSLLPFYGFSDSRNLFSGNPNLNPEYTDSYEIGYVRYFEKATLYSGLYYRHRMGVVERILTVDSSGFTNRFPINLSVQDAYGFEFNLNYDVLKWWNINGNLNLYRAITTGSYEGVDYGSDNFTSQGRIMNRFKFWQSDLQFTFNYRGPSVTVQGRSLGIYTVDLGWSKDILNGNGTITASVRDVFNNRKWRSYTNTETARQYQEFQWRQRQFLLTFSYRLNQNKSRRGKGEGDFEAGEDMGM